MASVRFDSPDWVKKYATPLTAEERINYRKKMDECMIVEPNFFGQKRGTKVSAEEYLGMSRLLAELEAEHHD